MPSISSEGLIFIAEIYNRDHFGDTIRGKSCTSYILAENCAAIEIEVRCYEHKQTSPPPILVEVYVDGVLRNVIEPKTGRGLAYQQFAEARIDRGLVMSEEGVLNMQHFRFVNLDLDDAVLNSRLVPEAGSIRVQIVHATLPCEKEERQPLRLPRKTNDYGVVTLLESELNNSIGVRFDGKSVSLNDTKYMNAARSVELMYSAPQKRGRKVLASFDFKYGTDDLLNQFQVLPSTHKLFDERKYDRRASELEGCSYRPRGRKYYPATNIIPFAELGYSTRIVQADDVTPSTLEDEAQETQGVKEAEEIEDVEMIEVSEMIEEVEIVEEAEEMETEMRRPNTPPAKINGASNLSLITPPTTVKGSSATSPIIIDDSDSDDDILIVDVDHDRTAREFWRNSGGY